MTSRSPETPGFRRLDGGANEPDFGSRSPLEENIPGRLDGCGCRSETNMVNSLREATQNQTGASKLALASLWAKEQFMADYRKAITNLRNGLAKAARQGSQQPERFPQADIVEGKEQPGRGPDDSPVHRESREIIPTPHFS